MEHLITFLLRPLAIRSAKLVLAAIDDDSSKLAMLESEVTEIKAEVHTIHLLVQRMAEQN